MPKQDLQGALAAERDLFGGQGGFRETPPRLLNRTEHFMLLLLKDLHGLLGLLQKLRHDLFREARNLGRQLHADGGGPGPKLTKQGLERPPLAGGELVRGQERLADTLPRALNRGKHLLLLGLKRLDGLLLLLEEGVEHFLREAGNLRALVPCERP